MGESVDVSPLWGRGSPDRNYKYCSLAVMSPVLTTLTSRHHEGKCSQNIVITLSWHYVTSFLQMWPSVMTMVMLPLLASGDALRPRIRGKKPLIGYVTSILDSDWSLTSPASEQREHVLWPQLLESGLYGRAPWLWTSEAVRKSYRCRADGEDGGEPPELGDNLCRHEAHLDTVTVEGETGAGEEIREVEIVQLSGKWKQS